MVNHMFAVCAYKDSPYLETCIRSLKRQTEPVPVILCTSTPSPMIEGLARKYDLPLCVREGESDICDDWNFAAACADARFVTIAHQDDCYHKNYAKRVRQCLERYPDTTVYMTDCALLKENEPVPPGLVSLVKRLLRLPLRLHAFADRTLIKRAPLVFGNPVICPSCTYNKEALGMPLFDSPYKFVLDWDNLWKLAARPGRFYCDEKPLIRYRIHSGSETKKCIGDNRRSREEIAMFSAIWPKPAVKLLMMFYRRAYEAYD